VSIIIVIFELFIGFFAKPRSMSAVSSTEGSRASNAPNNSKTRRLSGETSLKRISEKVGPNQKKAAR